MKSIIVSGADTGYWPFLSGMLASIEREAKKNDVAVGILDLGLARPELERLAQFGATIVQPGWDYDMAHFSEQPGNVYKAQTARPHLPRYFPGYDTYIWIDADAWVQNWSAIEALIDGASKRQFAICAETHKAYRNASDWKRNNPEAYSSYWDKVRDVFGKSTAKALSRQAPVNCGIFSAVANAPHWAAWDRCVAGAMKRLSEPFFYVEQLALNVIVFVERLPVQLLPAKYNWMCHKALPMLSATKRWIEPLPPYAELGIIHLIGDMKGPGDVQVAGADGKMHAGTLRHRPLTAPAS